MRLSVNGEEYEVTSPPDTPLLWVLRDELGLTGTKNGCTIGICGVCTIHLDEQPQRACLIPVESAAGRTIRTIEGLASHDEPGGERLHAVQQAFLDEQVPQCSWCMSGQMMTATALLAANPRPSEEAIIDAMSQNYCRCGCYVRIKAAVARAATLLTLGGQP